MHQHHKVSAMCVTVKWMANVRHAVSHKTSEFGFDWSFYGDESIKVSIQKQMVVNSTNNSFYKRQKSNIRRQIKKEICMQSRKERMWETNPSEDTRITGKHLTFAPSAITLHIKLSWYIVGGTITSSVEDAFRRTSMLFKINFGCKNKFFSSTYTTPTLFCMVITNMI